MLLPLLLCFCFGLTAQVDDGIYHVIEAFETTPGESMAPRTILEYNYRIVDSTAQSYKFVHIDEDNYVPLKLDKEPDRVLQDDGRSRMILTLEKGGKKQLKKLTKKFTGQRVAVVIDNEIVTMHKIREPITGGKIQITRCTDNACEYLIMELRDNVEG